MAVFFLKKKNRRNKTMMICVIFFILCSVQYVHAVRVENEQLKLCQSNCNSVGRIVGPTKMLYTRSYPFAIAPFPTDKFDNFCKLGCQKFYSDDPKNTTCKSYCDHFFRYKVTTGYSDYIEEAILQCKDGCDIGLKVCQAGYYCVDGNMLPCPPGTFREGAVNVSKTDLPIVHNCTLCPYGRYRSEIKGKSADECSKCPIGRYANSMGNTKESDCLRCPAGTNAEEEGMRVCTCIDNDSCDLDINGVHYFKNGVDYNRETIPFIGRW
jgi:hypothetical protein